MNAATRGGLALAEAIAPIYSRIAGVRAVILGGSVARVMGGNQMGIQLDQLSVGESERLQEFLLPLIPSD